MIVPLFIVMVILGIRIIEGDEHYGWIGAGQMVMSGADAFSATILAAVMEPDFIIKTQR